MGAPRSRIANGAIVIEMLAAAGPRIVGLRRHDSPANLLAETPDLGWETALGRYELLGGHRLWLAPEDLERAAIPDSEGLAVDLLADGVRLPGPRSPRRVRPIDGGPAGPGPGVAFHRPPRREPRVAPARAGPLVHHPAALGGDALLPLRRAVAGHETRPNRAFVLWPYSSLDDPRLHIRDGLVTVGAVAGRDLKVGCLDDSGWVA